MQKLTAAQSGSIVLQPHTADRSSLRSHSFRFIWMSTCQIRRPAKFSATGCVPSSKRRISDLRIIAVAKYVRASPHNVQSICTELVYEIKVWSIIAMESCRDDTTACRTRMNTPQTSQMPLLALTIFSGPRN